jgi:hypothetical protein
VQHIPCALLLPGVYFVRVKYEPKSIMTGLKEQRIYVTLCLKLRKPAFMTIPLDENRLLSGFLDSDIEKKYF